MAKIPKALEVYDHRRFGPVLGVSDEGSAAPHIAKAAYSSAKARAAGDPDVMTVGVIMDAERMGSAGEVPIGPPEYDRVLPAILGKTFCTTNVGVRVNTRLHQPLPEFPVADAAADEEGWLESIFAKFKPFLHTPDGQIRPLTIRLVVESQQSLQEVPGLVAKIEARRTGGDDALIGPEDLHRLSLLLVFEGLIESDADIDEIKKVIDLAAELDVPEVAVDGDVTEAARRRLGIQGLLNVLDPAAARDLLAYAKRAGVAIVYHYEIDPETAARTVWTGLNSACQNGLTAAKYGLLPLLLEQQKFVVENIQSWMKDWTPIPAFYVDTALVTPDDVYAGDRVVEAGRIWMSMVAENGAKVLLVDAPDRINPRRLLKKGGPNDPGVLSLDDLAVLLKHAQGLGLRVLWSGGVSAPEAYALGKLGVFGFFTTSSTARVVPVHASLKSDAQLAAEKEPTELGVRRIHALAQAGYLHSQVDDDQLCGQIEERSLNLIENGQESAGCKEALKSLDDILVGAWKQYWQQLD